MEINDEKRMKIILLLSFMIAALAARLLFLVDNSLREGDGYGLAGDGAIQTIPILIILALMLWLIAGFLRGKKINFDTNNRNTIVIMIFMFITGFYLSPSTDFSSRFSNSNTLGLIIIIVPVIIIVAMLMSVYGEPDSLLLSEEE